MNARRLTAAPLAALPRGLAFGSAKAQPNLSGTWVLDKSQSSVPSRNGNGEVGRALQYASQPEQRESSCCLLDQPR